MRFANCATLAAVLTENCTALTEKFTTLTENLRLCSSAEAGVVLKF